MSFQSLAALVALSGLLSVYFSFRLIGQAEQSKSSQSSGVPGAAAGAGAGGDKSVAAAGAAGAGAAGVGMVGGDAEESAPSADFCARPDPLVGWQVLLATS